MWNVFLDRGASRSRLTEAAIRLVFVSVTFLSPAEIAFAQGESVVAISERERFFSSDSMYFVRITSWNPAWMSVDQLKGQERKTPGARFEIYKTSPQDPDGCPDENVSEDQLIYRTSDFSLGTSGNMTDGTPKSSYKIRMTNKEDRLFSMSALNLKSMWNDVSQMREAIAWRLFFEAGVPGSGHTYAKFCINGRYYGLYSIIENVDKSFLKSRFGEHGRGNLYKAYWSEQDIGPATLAKGGYKNPDNDERTFRLKTNEDEPAASTYEDLNQFVQVLNQTSPSSPEFKKKMESIFDVRGFLRWAAINMLLGAWDNYWATPANYYLYNAGQEGAEKKFMERPYFVWIPWDYDNVMGITYWATQWQYADIVDWPSSTKEYYSGARTSHLPLIVRLLQQKEFLCYYLDEIEKNLDLRFNEKWITDRIDGLWPHIETAVYAESNNPEGAPHTGRQFTNHQVYRNGYMNHEMNQGNMRAYGILHYVRMRHDSAREQLKKYRLRCEP